MARERTDLLNAYELLLLQNVLILLFDLEEKKLGKKAFKEVGEELEVDNGTIAKFFNASYNKNVPSFNKNLLDEIIYRIGLEKVKAWDYFKRLYIAPSLLENPKDFIPYGHFVDLSDDRKKQMISDVDITLRKIFPDHDFSKSRYQSIESLDGKSRQETSVKMKRNFLNTTWYLYLFFSNMGEPKLGRLILRIGDNSDDVQLEHFRTPENNHFSGRVEFDKSESYLIFNLKTTATDEKDLHMKVAATTGDRPEITLGYFFNIGLNFPTLAWGDVVLEHISDLSNEEIIAKPIDAYDPDFFNIHWSIREYLRYDDPNITILPSKIYSKQKLSQLIKKRRDTVPNKPNEVRQQKKFKVLIRYPKYSIPEEEKFKYADPTLKLQRFLESKGFEIIKDPMEETSYTDYPPIKPSFFYNRIRECDIFILLYFDKVVSNCISELAWAFQMEKKILIFVPDSKTLPRTYQYDLSRFAHFGYYNTPDEAVDWLLKMHTFLLKEELEQQTKNMPQE